MTDWTITRKAGQGLTYYAPLPAPIEHREGTAVQVMKWYNRTTRDWVVSLADDRGWQVGPSTYVYSAPEADAEAAYLIGQAHR